VFKVALNPGGNGCNFWCGVEVALGLVRAFDPNFHPLFFGSDYMAGIVQVQWHDGSYTLYDGEEDLYGYKGWRVVCNFRSASFDL
jgi:hypothetical protein